MISTRERKRLTPVQIGLATSYTKNELIADQRRLEDTLERKQAELKELQDLVHAKQREIWRVRDSNQRPSSGNETQSSVDPREEEKRRLRQGQTPSG